MNTRRSSKSLGQPWFRVKAKFLGAHVLSQDQLNLQSDICSKFLSKKTTFNWLDNLITGDEKWVLYVNITCNRQWLRSRQQSILIRKPDKHEIKAMLTVWWSVHEIAYWELLPTGTSIMGDIYCAQLQRLKEKLSANRPEHEKIYFQHDNARPHIAKSVRQKILQHD